MKSSFQKIDTQLKQFIAHRKTKAVDKVLQVQKQSQMVNSPFVKSLTQPDDLLNDITKIRNKSRKYFKTQQNSNSLTKSTIKYQSSEEKKCIYVIYIFLQVTHYSHIFTKSGPSRSNKTIQNKMMAIILMNRKDSQLSLKKIETTKNIITKNCLPFQSTPKKKIKEKKIVSNILKNLVIEIDNSNQQIPERKIQSFVIQNKKINTSHFYQDSQIRMKTQGRIPLEDSFTMPKTPNWFSQYFEKFSQVSNDEKDYLMSFINNKWIDYVIQTKKMSHEFKKDIISQEDYENILGIRNNFEKIYGQEIKQQIQIVITKSLINSRPEISIKTDPQKEEKLKSYEDAISLLKQEQNENDLIEFDDDYKLKIKRKRIMKKVLHLTKICREQGVSITELLENKNFSFKPYQRPGSFYFIEKVKQGDILAVKDLLNQDPQLMNEYDHLQMNALHWSVYKGHEQLVKMILEKINPNTSDSLGRTAMYFACLKSNVPILLKLLKAGASPWNLDFRDYFFLTKSMVAKDLLKKAQFKWIDQKLQKR